MRDTFSSIKRRFRFAAQGPVISLEQEFHCCLKNISLLSVLSNGS